MNTKLNCKCSFLLSMIYVLVWIFLFGDVEGKGGWGGSRGGGGSGLFSALSGFVILVIVSICCGGCCGFGACFYWLGKFDEERQKKNVEVEKQTERDAR